MFEYGALLNISLSEHAQNVFYAFINFAKGVPSYGYAIGLIVFYLILHLLIKKP